MGPGHVWISTVQKWLNGYSVASFTHILTGDRVTCATDRKHTFDSLLLFGNELSLILFELLLICAVDIQTNSFVADAIITYVVMEVSRSGPAAAARHMSQFTPPDTTQLAPSRLSSRPSWPCPIGPAPSSVAVRLYTRPSVVRIITARWDAAL